MTAQIFRGAASGARSARVRYRQMTTSTELPFINLTTERDPALLPNRPLDAARAFLAGVAAADVASFEPGVAVLHLISIASGGLLDVALGYGGRAMRTVLSTELPPEMVRAAACEMCARLLKGDGEPATGIAAAAALSKVDEAVEAVRVAQEAVDEAGKATQAAVEQVKSAGDPVEDAEAEIAAILRTGWPGREQLTRAAMLATFIAERRGYDYQRAEHYMRLAANALQ